MTNSENPYRAVGTFTGTSYVERSADSKLIESIKDNQRYPYILAPRQSGKSSLIMHTMQTLGFDKEHYCCVFIDLTTFPLNTASDYDNFLKLFSKKLINSLKSNTTYKLKPNSDLEYVIDKICQHIDKQIIIFIDEIDALLNIYFKDNFLGLIRSFFNKRAINKNFKKIQFVLAGAILATKLISKPNISPFNVGESIVLDNLSYDEVYKLVKHLPDNFAKKEVATQIYKHTNGSIYLTQLVLESLWESHTKQDPNLEKLVEVDEVVDKIIQNSPQNMHFINIHSSIAKNPMLLDAFHTHVKTSPTDTIYQEELKTIGIIDSGKEPYRNLIYKNVFGPNGKLSLFKENYLPKINFVSPSIENISLYKMKKIINKVEILLLTVSEWERKAVLSEMTPLPKETAILEGAISNITYRIGQFGNYYAAYTETIIENEGRQGAILTVEHVIKELKPKAIFLLGVAFGIDKNKQKLGDVLIAESIFPYELQKINEKFSTRRGQPVPCGNILSERFRMRRTDWNPTHEGRSLDVAVQQGLVLSGEKIVNNKEFRDALIKEFPDAIGGEVEGAGAYAAVVPPTEAILIKSICDWADGTKNDDAQPFAAFTSVSLAKHVLSKPDVLHPLITSDAQLQDMDFNSIPSLQDTDHTDLINPYLSSSSSIPNNDIFEHNDKILLVSGNFPIENQIENTNPDNTILATKEVIRQLVSDAKNSANIAKFEEALNFYDKAIAISKPLVEKGDFEFTDHLAVSLMNKGILLSELGQLEDGLTYTEMSIKYYKQDPKLTYNSISPLNNKGVILSQLGRLSEAILSYEEAINTIKKDKLKEEQVYILAGLTMNKGQVLDKLNSLSEAASCYDEAISLCENLNKEIPISLYNVLAGSLSNKGIILNKTGHPFEALQLQDRAIFYYKELVDKEGEHWLPEVAQALTTKGLCLDDLSNFTDAISCYDSAINILKNLIDKGHRELTNNLATAMHNKSIALKEIGYFSEALAHCDEVIKIREDLVEKQSRTDLSSDLASTFLAKGLVLVKLERLSEANKFYDKGLAIYSYLVKDKERVEFTKDLAMAYNNTANVLRELNQEKTAINYYDQAITYCTHLVEEKGQKHFLSDLAMYFSNKAIVLARIARINESIDYYDKAITIYRKLIQQEERKKLLESLASTLLNKASILGHKQPLQTIAYYDEAIKYYNLLLKNTEEIDIIKNLIGAYNSKANELALLGDIWKAIACFDEATKFCERLNKKTYINVRQEIAMLFSNKGFALSFADRRYEGLGFLDDATNIYNDLLKDDSLLPKSKHLELTEGFAKTLWHKGNILFDLSRFYDSLDSYNKAIHWLEFCIQAGKAQLPNLLDCVWSKMKIHIQLKHWDGVVKDINQAYTLVKPFLTLDDPSNLIEWKIWKKFLELINSLPKQEQQQIYSKLNSLGDYIKKTIQELS